MRVKFLIAGAQKSATTALHSFLNEHHQLFLPPEKELHYFDQEEGVNWSRPDYSNYDCQFESARMDHVCGEATPAYMFWPASFARIRAYNADMRFVVSLRDPIDRAYSQWKMEVTRSCEKLNFSTAIRDGRKRIPAVCTAKTGSRSDKAHLKDYFTYSYLERGLYGPQIRRLLSHFPHSQVFFTTNEQLSFDFHQTLDGICEFLDVDAYRNYPEFRMVRPLESRHDLGEMCPIDRAYLAEFFQNDIEDTEILTNLDLSAWRQMTSLHLMKAG